MMSITKLTTVILIALTLTACGGGGGGSTSSPIQNIVNPPTFNLSVLSLPSALSAIQNLENTEALSINSMYDTFKFVSSHTIDKLEADKVTVKVNGQDMTLTRAWSIAKGFTKQYYTGYETFWKNMHDSQQYDDADTAFENIQYASSKEPGTTDDLMKYYEEIGNSTRNIDRLPTQIITWTSGVYDPWALTTTDAQSSTNASCTVDIYSQNVWWEKNINGVKTGIKGSLIRTDTDERNEQCPVTLVSSSNSPSSEDTFSSGTPVVVTSHTDVNRVSTDSNGSTVVKTYRVYTDKTTTPVTTTTTTTVTTTHTYSDGSTTSEDAVSTSVSTSNTVTTATREELTNTEVTANVTGTTSSTETTVSSVDSDPTVSTTSTSEDRTSTDADGSTVIGTYTIYTDVSTTVTTTTTTDITTTVTSLTDGSSTSVIADPIISTSLSNTVTTATREELTNTEVTANVKSTSDSDSTTDVTTEGTPVTITTSTEDIRTSTDENGSTVVKTYTIHTDTTTIPNATVTTVKTTRTTLWTDGSTTTAVINTVDTVANTDVATVSTREELTNTVVTANVKSTSDGDTTSSTSSEGDAVVTTTNTNETRTTTDENGSTVNKVFIIYTDKSTVTTTTVTTVTTTRTTLWTDGSTTTAVINTNSSSATSDAVTTTTREVLTSTSITPNVASTSDSDSTTTVTTEGSATLVTTSSLEDRTSTDADGSTVVKTYTIYTDTTSTPTTTTATVTTTRTTLWTNGASTSEVISTSSTDTTTTSATTATREVLTNTVVTANVASTSTVYKNERNLGTIKSDLISELHGTNSDTIPTGTDADGNTIYQAVTLYYYSWHKTVYDKVLKDKYTRVTYTDGSVIDSLVTADVDFSTTIVKEYELDPWGGKKTTTQRVPVGETFVGNPVAPGDSGGSSGVYTYAQRDANHNTTNFNATTYYNDNALGTATAGVNNDPSTYETAEAENGATLVTYANHAYSRGWTGEGSTALIMDTGIDQDHPEFAGKIKYKWDAGYATPYEDENGHGTHVAGIVSANKDGVGIHGVAFDTQLAIAKIGEASGVSLSGAKQALNWAKQYDDIVVANLSANTNYSAAYKDAMTDQGNGVFTNSHAIYGGSNYYNLETASSWKDVIPDELVLVVAAGNTDLGYVQNPATMASAVDANGDLELDGRMLVAGNWNTSTQTIDGAKSGHVCKDYTTQCNDTHKISDFYLLAPGTNINSTQNGGGYTRMSGTSMAAPVVTAGVSIVHQMWPYMKGSNIAQVLLQTANKDLSNYSVNTHGQGLLDLDTATQPVGDLGISTTGRTGDVAPLSGHIAVSGVDGAVVSSVSAVDDFDRDFNVDLSSMVNSNNTSIEQLKHKRGQSWAVKQASISTSEYKNVTVGTDNKGTYALGYTHDINNNLDLNVTYSETKNSPWINMSGVWGEVNGATTVDTSLTWSDNELWAQVGVMNTKTDINKGLVVNVDDAISAYFVGGVDLDDFTFYAGVKPKVIRGNIDLSIPDSVDSNGIMHYNSTTSNYGASTVPFVGATHTYYFKENDTDVSLNTDVIADVNGEHSVNVMFEYKF